MKGMRVTRYGEYVVLERTTDGDGLRPDMVHSWNLDPHEWRSIADFAAMERERAVRS